MSIKVIHGKKEHTVDDDSTTVEGVLDRIGVNPETVIVEMEDEIVSLGKAVVDGDKLNLINVVSGG